jgi:VWFA-related protein
MNRTRGVFVILVLSLATGAGAQQPSELPRVTKSIELSILNLDVIVTDKDGKPVRDLQAANFEVRIGRKPAEITNFAEYRPETPAPEAPPQPPSDETPAAAPAAAPAAPTAVPRPSRHLVVFIDRLFLPDPNIRGRTFDSLKALLARTLGPGDEAMVVAWHKGVRTLRPFTASHAELDRFLDAEEKKSRMLPQEAMALDQLSRDDAWFKSLPSGAGGDGIGMSQRALAAEAYADMRAKANALRALIATLGGIEGRKILVFASNRFGRYAGFEYFLGPRDGIGRPQPSDSKEFDANAIVESVADAANANGVTIYPIFPAGWPDDFQGLNAGNPLSANPALNAGAPGGRGQAIVANEVAALDEISEKTGGLMAVGPVEIAKMVPRAIDDLESYYSLGVSSPPGKTERELSIGVTVKNKSYRVRARRAVVEKSPLGRMKDRVLANLFRRDTASHIRITAVATAPGAKKKGRYTVPLEIRVPIDSLARLPGPKGETGAFSVFVASAGPDGAFSEVTQQTRPFEIPRAELARAKTGHFTYEFPLVTSTAVNRISIGVLDDVGKEAGFLQIDVADLPAAAPR